MMPCHVAVDGRGVARGGAGGAAANFGKTVELMRIS
jgi:hypothetical protein